MSTRALCRLRTHSFVAMVRCASTASHRQARSVDFPRPWHFTLLRMTTNKPTPAQEVKCQPEVGFHVSWRPSRARGGHSLARHRAPRARVQLLRRARQERRASRHLRWLSNVKACCALTALSCRKGSSEKWGTEVPANCLPQSSLAAGHAVTWIPVHAEALRGSQAARHAVMGDPSIQKP